MTRLELTRFSWVQKLLHNRWPLFLLRAFALALFIFTILAGLLGTPVGSHNFAIIFVWIVWWTALKLFFIPFGGRSWCSICPIPMPGEWLQNGGLLRSRAAGIGLGRRWPRFLKGKWLQAGGFLMIGLFGTLVLTSASVTAAVLLAILILALALSLVFDRRAFCQSLCPIGGFTGLYAQAGPVEVRVKDRALCASHTQKTCYQVCPWGQYPPAMKTSADCGLCMECLRACPTDNIAVSLRPWGSDLQPETKPGLDEAFLGLVMLATALVDAAIFLGPWGPLKTAAYEIGTSTWWIFSGLFLLGALVVLPGFYAAAAWFSGGMAHIKSRMASASQVLVPLGLAGWMAFTVSFAFAKFSSLLPVLSDPFGWGWNLLGWAGAGGIGETTTFSVVLQTAILAGGLGWASRVALRTNSTSRRALPWVIFSAGFTLAMLWLLVG